MAAYTNGKVLDATVVTAKRAGKGASTIAFILKTVGQLWPKY